MSMMVVHLIHDRGLKGRPRESCEGSAKGVERPLCPSILVTFIFLKVGEDKPRAYKKNKEGLKLGDIFNNIIGSSLTELEPLTSPLEKIRGYH